MRTTMQRCAARPTGAAAAAAAAVGVLLAASTATAVTGPVSGTASGTAPAGAPAHLVPEQAEQAAGAGGRVRADAPTGAITARATDSTTGKGIEGAVFEMVDSEGRIQDSCTTAQGGRCTADDVRPGLIWTCLGDVAEGHTMPPESARCYGPLLVNPGDPRVVEDVFRLAPDHAPTDAPDPDGDAGTGTGSGADTGAAPAAEPGGNPDAEAATAQAPHAAGAGTADAQEAEAPAAG